MEEKINIAAILESKPQGTKLYSLTYGDCSYQGYTGDFGIECQSQNGVQFNLDEYGKYCIDGECILFPSKEMRDWNKFAWKKGDVLVNSRGLKILFDRWANGNYTSFYAKTINLVEDAFLDTNLHTLASEKEAKSFIKCIEEKLGGKLNLGSLEIEKQPEFKDGDIVTQGVLKGVNVCIIKNCIDKFDNKYNYYARYNTQDKEINYDDWSHISPFAKFATDYEKQQLFDALAKENKAWDAEEKQIVDLKPKCEFKPFDKVLVKDNPYGSWEPALFWKKVDVKDLHPYKIIGGKRYRYCEPYEGNECLLDNK